MPPQIVLREFRFPDDYDPALTVWENMETGVRVGPSDSPAEIQKKVARDPDLFLVAEMDGRVIGTVIGGYDGRRGMIYHLAVLPAFRGRGIGSQLLTEVERRLQARGCLKCYLLVIGDNREAIEFYEQRGWFHMAEDRVYAKEFP